MKWFLKKFNQLDTKTLWKIYHLRVKVFIVEQKMTCQEIDRQDLHSYHLFATNDKDEIVAYARFYKKADQFSFGRVVIPKSYRGKGLGEELIKHLLIAMKKVYGNVQVIIQAQYYAKGFYQRCGFHTVGKPFSEVGRKHITMIRDKEK